MSLITGVAGSSLHTAVLRPLHVYARRRCYLPCVISPRVVRTIRTTFLQDLQFDVTSELSPSEALPWNSPGMAEADHYKKLTPVRQPIFETGAYLYWT
jgi:hypothetical protein